MALAKGISSHAGFGVETTWGTKGTIDAFYRIVSENLRHFKEPFVSESLNPDWNDFLYYGHGRNEGSIVFEAGYTGLELFWWALMGTYSYTADTPVAGANTHTFTYDPTTNVFPTGLSIEAVRGIGGTDEVAYLGMFPTKATIDFTPNQLSKVTFDMVGQGFSRGAATASSFPTDNFMVPSHVTALTINGTALTVRSGTIEIEVARDGQREHYGDSLVKFPEIIGRPIAYFNFECDFSDETGVDTDALLQAFEDETELSGPIISHQGNIVTGATKEQFVLTATNCWIMEATPATSGFEITGVSIRGRITNGLSLSFINGSTQAT